MRHRTFISSLLIAVTLTLIPLFSIFCQTPPPALPADSPAQEFSAARALGDLRPITQRPHPIGSLAQSEIREFIFNRLTALGVKPEVQQEFVVSTANPGSARAGVVRNIVARLAGTNNSKAVLLVGHYDSTPTSYGACDNGAAVVTMLETLRALKNGQPLRNDLILLFTDGEEVGLLGAEAFVQQYPLAREVGLALNFEARGCSGPSIMFETSQENRGLIAEFAKAAPRPVATSLAYEIYRRLPNDTDFTVFKRSGIAGLNFAFINGATHYHNQLDAYENIDERSLQHHGSYALALTRHFGNFDLNQPQTGRAVYFDLFGRTLVHYSTTLAFVLTTLTAILFVAVLVVGRKTGRLTFRGMALAFLAVLLLLVVSAIATTLLWRFVVMLHAGYRQMPLGFTYNTSFYALGFAALTTALTGALFLLLRRRIGAANLSFGVLSCWLVLLCLTMFFVPGASFLFMWPLLFSLLAFGYYFMSGSPEELSASSLLAFVLCALPGLVLVAPALYHISAAIPPSLLGAVMVVVGLLAALSLLYLNFWVGAGKWLLPGLALLGFLGLMLAGALTSGVNERHPIADSLFYALDADSGKALWGSVEATPDVWTGQFLRDKLTLASLPNFFPTLPARFLCGEAPIVSLLAPEVSLVDDKADNGERKLQLRVRSPRRAPVISLYFEEGTAIRGAVVNGKPVNVPSAPGRANTGVELTIRCYAVEDPIELKLQTPAGGVVKVRVVDQTYGLPEVTGASFNSRPGSIVSAPYQITDSTFVSKSYTF